MKRAPWTIMIDAQRVTAFAGGRDGAPTTVATATWTPDAPERTVEALEALEDRPASIVLVIGLAWLESACPSLPPVSVPVKRRMLSIEGDRWFPFASRPATAMIDDFVLAMPEDRLEQWRAAFGRLAPVVGVTTVVHAARLTGQEGAFELDAGPGERGFLQLDHARVIGLRRTRALAGTDARSVPAERLVRAVQQAAMPADRLPADLQLLGVAAEEREQAAYRARWWRSGAGFAVAMTFALWSLANRRERQLDAATREAARLESEAAPALDAMARLELAREETRRLTLPADASPSEIIAVLGDLLPSDVFVQRVEWDGAGWKMDGSATDAAALIPRLDAHPMLRNVRMLAPSNRFVDGGRQRSSFSIGFDVERAR